MTLKSFQHGAYEHFFRSIQIRYYQSLILGNVFGGLAAFVGVFYTAGSWALNYNFLGLRDLTHTGSILSLLYMFVIGIISLIPLFISLYLCFFWYPRRVGKRKEVQLAYLGALAEELAAAEQGLPAILEEVGTVAENQIAMIRESLPAKRQLAKDKVEATRLKLESAKELFS